MAAPDVWERAAWDIALMYHRYADVEEFIRARVWDNSSINAKDYVLREVAKREGVAVSDLESAATPTAVVDLVSIAKLRRMTTQEFDSHLNKLLYGEEQDCS